MEMASTRCILAAMERQLTASSRGAHGLCSHCADEGTTCPEPKLRQIRPNYSDGGDKSWAHKKEHHLSRSYRQLALGEVAIHVVEREVGDPRVHGELPVVPHLDVPKADQINKGVWGWNKDVPATKKERNKEAHDKGNEYPYLGDESGGLAAGGGGGGRDGRRVGALGVEEAGDRLVSGAGEGVLQVELVLVGVLLLPRHIHGCARPYEEKGREHAKKRRPWLYGEEEEATICAATQCASTSSVWLGRWPLIREHRRGLGTMVQKVWIWGSFCKDRGDDEARHRGRVREAWRKEEGWGTTARRGREESFSWVPTCQ